MITVFNALPSYAGTFSNTVNPVVGRGATAAAEITNDIIWLVETQL